MQDSKTALHALLLEALSLSEDPGARVSRWRRDTSAQADVRGTRRGGFELPGPGHAYARAAHIAAEWLDAGRAAPDLAVEGARCVAARSAASEERVPAPPCLALVLAAEGSLEAVPLTVVCAISSEEEGDDLVFAEHADADGDADADVYGANASSDLDESLRGGVGTRAKSSPSPRSPQSPRSPRIPRSPCSPGGHSRGGGATSAGGGAFSWGHEWDGATPTTFLAQIRAPSPARAARGSTAASPPPTELVGTSLLGPTDGKGRGPIPVSALEAALRDAAARTARDAREAVPQFFVGTGAASPSAAGERARAAARLFLASSADREVKDAEREHARREAAVARAAARTVPGTAAKKG